MLELTTCPPRGLRFLCRLPAQEPTIHLTIPSVRPSLLNRRLASDIWVEARDVETLAVRYGDEEFVRINASPFDLPSFNQLLDRARHTRLRSGR